MSPYEELVELHCCFYLHSRASCGTLAHIAHLRHFCILCTHPKSCFGGLNEQSGYVVLLPASSIWNAGMEDPGYAARVHSFKIYSPPNPKIFFPYCQQTAVKIQLLIRKTVKCLETFTKKNVCISLPMKARWVHYYCWLSDVKTSNLSI